MVSVRIDMTDLEYEIVKQLLDAPMRDYLLKVNWKMLIGKEPTEDEIESAWESISESWAEAK